LEAVRLDINIRQGAKYELNIQAKNQDGTVKDLTGYSARMQVRPTVESTTILLDANTSNGRITINAPGGIVSISIGADVTSTLNWNVAPYDLEIYTADPANVFALIEGYASLSKEVTR
jgi:hypothetical protein